MREICQSGSEGGGGVAAPYPYPAKNRLCWERGTPVPLFLAGSTIP